jgi:hypothetical protein
MKSLVIDATVTVSNAPSSGAIHFAPRSRSGLGVDILHVIIDGRKLPESIPPLERSFPSIAMGRSSGNRILKDYVLSRDPYEVPAVQKRSYIKC